MKTDEQAIRALHTAWIEAVNAVNVSHLLSLMTDDVVFLSPGQAPLGREDFAAGFTAAHREFKIGCVSAPLEIVVAGDIAYMLCRDSLSLMPRAGGPATMLSGHRITVYRKEADRNWRLARDAHTLSPQRADLTRGSRGLLRAGVEP